VRAPRIGDLGTYRGGLAGELAADAVFDHLIRILWTRKRPHTTMYAITAPSRMQMISWASAPAVAGSSHPGPARDCDVISQVGPFSALDQGPAEIAQITSAMVEVARLVG
jgi:hypothetical protein